VTSARFRTFEVSHVATREDLERLTRRPVRGATRHLFFTTVSCDRAHGAAKRSFRPFVTAADSSACTARRTPGTPFPSTASSGRILDGHPWHQRVGSSSRIGRTLPRGASATPRDHRRIYQFPRLVARSSYVLLRLDPRSVDVGRGKRPDGDYALAWTKAYWPRPGHLHGPGPTSGRLGRRPFSGAPAGADPVGSRRS